ncbi:hypothetical protein HELRODRAFT_172880 [Helobdella robusta]|uniref:Uncharacterized protein n=1 Tax=Helobdella robusta TaxID=6412 RepID=T1F622_HELRO|nr:hypothetical protein HELRODRAFT_172880 [Helobdella robusta]ESO03857.1 hypothetical protein HELRODRAFT_172880 [Helobdella robusta]
MIILIVITHQKDEDEEEEEDEEDDDNNDDDDENEDDDDDESDNKTYICGSSNVSVMCRLCFIMCSPGSNLVSAELQIHKMHQAVMFPCAHFVDPRLSHYDERLTHSISEIYRHANSGKYLHNLQLPGRNISSCATTRVSKKFPADQSVMITLQSRGMCLMYEFKCPRVKIYFELE